MGSPLFGLMEWARLFLVLTCSWLSVALQRVEDDVPSVPGYGDAPTRMFAGQISFNASYDKKLFYWFAECERGNVPGETPFVLWLNGGPGASSLTGFLTENIGPLTLQLNGSLTRNHNAWTQFANLIVFENPVGVGFSQTKPGGYVTTQEQMAAELHHGLMTFFSRHPNYRQNPLWISGESFAGHYVPYFAWEVHQQGKLNLKGIVLGNGMLQMELQYAAIPEFAYANGLVDESGRKEVEKLYEEQCIRLIKAHQNLEAYKQCEATTKWLYGVKAGSVFYYDIGVEDPHAFDTLTTVMSNYLNTPATQVALHVSPTTWIQYDEAGPVSDALALDFVRPSDWVVERLLNSGYRAVMYNGVRDGSACGHLGMSKAILNMNWYGAKAFKSAKQRPWHCNGGLLCGYNRTEGPLTYVTYVRTGHLVPTTVPRAALDMWHRLLAQSDPPTVVLGPQRLHAGALDFAQSVARGNASVFALLLLLIAAVSVSCRIAVWSRRRWRRGQMQACCQQASLLG